MDTKKPDMLLYLAKVVRKKSHAEEMIAGRLFLNRLGWFTEAVENDDEDARGDEMEASLLLQGDRIIDSTINGLPVTVRRVSAQVEHLLNRHVFCLYAGHTGSFTKLHDGNLKSSEDKSV